MDMGKDLTQIAMTLAGIALVALLVSRADGVVKIIDSGAGAYAGLLRTVTLQSGYGNAFGN